jgi:hypothetical protein
MLDECRFKNVLWLKVIMAPAVSKPWPWQVKVGLIHHCDIKMLYKLTTYC